MLGSPTVEMDKKSQQRYRTYVMSVLYLIVQIHCYALNLVPLLNGLSEKV